MSYELWCRLCGNCESLLRIEPKAVEIVEHVCKIPASVTYKICIECTSLLQEIQIFMNKTNLANGMFLMLENSLEVMDHSSLNEIRAQHSLKPLKTIDIEEDFSHNNLPSSSKLFKEEEGDEETEYLVTKVEMLSEGSAEYDDIQYAEEESILDEEEEEESDSGEFIETSESEESIKEKIPTIKREKGSRPSTYKLKREKEDITEDEKLYQYICHVCNQEFTKICFLSSHTRTEHSELPQVKCFCGKNLATWKRLMIHKRKHFPDKVDVKFECKPCHLTFKTQAGYDNHMEQRHGPNSQRYICSQCGREFKEPKVLRDHEKIHLPDEEKYIFQCTDCEKKFMRKVSLQNHTLRVHERTKSCFCEVCGRGFVTKVDLKNHMIVHSTEKNFECEICRMKFKSKNYLRIHKKSHMQKATGEVFECELCGKEFDKKENLKKHFLVHTDEKKHKCPHCPNEFKRLETLKDHVNGAHTGERPYACNFCDRTFVNSSNRRKHKLKDHPVELAAYEAVHGKKGTKIEQVMM